MLIEVNARLTFQVTSDKPCQRLSNHQADRLIGVAPKYRLEGGLDSLHRAFDCLSLRWANRLGILHPLAEQLGVSPLDLVDLKPLP
jgi:hypothetical protein